MEEFENFMKENRDSFDVNEPALGHHDRLKEKLAQQHGKKLRIRRIQWSVAASVAVVLVTSFLWRSGRLNTSPEMVDHEQPADSVQEESLPPELSEVEMYYAHSVEEKVKYLKKQFGGKNEHVVNCLNIIKDLEENYRELKVQLRESPNEQMVVNAMIMNYQTRLDILELLINQMKERSSETQPTQLQEQKNELTL